MILFLSCGGPGLSSEVGRERVMQMLHESYPGMTSIKVIAQGVVWWTGIDAKIERKIKECPEC